MWTQNQDVAALDSAAAGGSIVQVRQFYSCTCCCCHVALVSLRCCCHGHLIRKPYKFCFAPFYVALLCLFVLLCFAADLVRWVDGNCDLSMSELGTWHLIFYFILMLYFVLFGRLDCCCILEVLFSIMFCRVVCSFGVRLILLDYRWRTSFG